MIHQMDKPSAAAIPETSSVDAGESSTPDAWAVDDGLWRRLFGPSGPGSSLGHTVEQNPVLHVQDLSEVCRSRLAVDGQLWDDLLAGRTSRLQPCLDSAAKAAPAVGASVAFDQDLDEAQRETVHRALSSPDLFLIQGAPGSGKSRVLAEVVRRAVVRGERILVTGPACGGIDAILARISQDENLLVVRWGFPGNGADGCLNPTAQPLTPEELAGRLAQRCQAQARQSVQDAAARVRLAEQHVRFAEELYQTAVQWQDIRRLVDELDQQRQPLLLWTRDAVAGETCSFDDPGFVKQRKEEEKRHTAAAHEAEAQLETVRRLCAQKRRDYDAWAAKVKAQSHVVEVKRRRRFLTWTWWKTLFQGRASERLEEFISRHQEAEQAWQESERHRQVLEEACAQEQKRHADAVRQLLRSEVGRRLAALDCRAAELNGRQQSLEAVWKAKATGCPATTALPEVPSIAAADAARAQAQAELDESRRAAAAAEQWLAAQPIIAAELPAEIFGLAQVVAAPVTVVAADGGFSRCRFDLAIVDDADWLAEADLRRLAARADRLVLAGQPPPGESPSLRSGAPGSVFGRLWRSLHCDPRDLPYQWIEDGEQLICRLESVPAEERFRLEREPVADHPEVELRIWAPSDAPPRLAEVVFPKASFSIIAAKRFLYHQLQALAIRPGSACLRWRMGGQSLLFEASAAAAPAGNEVAVPLEEGVREVVQPAPDSGRRSPAVYWSTVRLEFDLGTGWDQGRAAQWLWERCGLRDLGRTSYLHVVYRPHPEVAHFCASVMPEPHVVALPPTRFVQAKHPLHDLVSPGVQVLTAAPPARAGLKPLNRGGKNGGRNGLFRPETPPVVHLDNAGERQLLPAYLQSRLPKRGSVLPAEAEVILGRLRALELAAGRRGTRARPAQVAVLAWQPAQAEMLRLLWESTPVNDRPFAVVFSTPRGFRGCEADLVFLSLTAHPEQGRRSADGKPLNHLTETEPMAGCSPGPGSMASLSSNFGELRDAGDLVDWRTALSCARSSLLLVRGPAPARRSGKAPAGRSLAEAAFMTRMLEAVEEIKRRPRAAKACEGISA